LKVSSIHNAPFGGFFFGKIDPISNPSSTTPPLSLLSFSAALASFLS
jgi:hypothetical protein